VIGHAAEIENGLQLWFIVEINRSTRDIASMIRNPLEDGRHFRNGNDKAEIARSGLAQSNDVNALPVDLYFEMIDSIVVLQNFTRNFAIAFTKRIHGTFESAFRFTTQQQHAIAQ
jgi:hypothetical protein